jgi:hypothetical protein
MAGGYPRLSARCGTSTQLITRAGEHGTKSRGSENHETHVDGTAQLYEKHNITYRRIDRVVAVVNWLGTEHPSPAYPQQRRQVERRQNPEISAYGAATRSYPLLRGAQPGRWIGSF